MLIELDTNCFPLKYHIWFPESPVTIELMTLLTLIWSYLVFRKCVRHCYSTHCWPQYLDISKVLCSQILYLNCFRGSKNANKLKCEFHPSAVHNWRISLRSHVSVLCSLASLCVFYNCFILSFYPYNSNIGPQNLLLSIFLTIKESMYTNIFEIVEAVYL